MLYQNSASAVLVRVFPKLKVFSWVVSENPQHAKHYYYVKILDYGS